jgi:hypothetical protein
MRNQKFFFVYGSGRSGTSLFCSRLNYHSDLLIPDESHFPAFAEELLEKKEIGHANYLLLANLFLLTSAQGGWGFSCAELQELFRKNKPNSLSEALIVILDEFARKEGKSISKYGVKRPMMIFFLEKVLSSYPGAKLVHVVRDGRDVFLSYQKVHAREGISFGPKTIYSGAIYWQLGISKAQKVEAKNQSYRVRYEDLLSDSTAVLAEACRFLGIENQAEEMSGNRAGDKVSFIGTQKSAVHHENLQREILSDNKNKWKQELKPIERRVFEVFAYSGLRDLCYEIEGGIVSKILHLFVGKPTLFFADLLNSYRYRKRFAKWEKKLQSLENN